MDGGGGGRWRLRRGGANGGGAKPPDGTLPLAGRGHPGPAPPTGRPALPTSSSVRFLSGRGRPAPSTRRERSAPSSGRLAPVTGRPSPSTDSPAPSTGRPAPSTGGPTPVTGRPAPPPERSAHLAQAPPPLVGRRLPSAEHPRSGTNLRLPPRGRGRPLPAAGHSPSSKPAPGPQHAAARPSHSLRRQGNNTGAPGKAQTRISFGQLQSLAADDGVQILQKLSRPDLLSLFAKLTDEARLEVSWMSLVVKVLAKLACVEYQPLVIRLFCAICKENFLDQLLLRIVQPGALSSGAAQLSAYVDFYQDFTILAHGIVRLLPTLASEKLHNLLQMACLMLTQMPSFDSKARICKELELVCAKLTDGEARLKSREPAARTGREFQFDELDPPDNYRHLSVYPTAEDIVDGEPPYLRRILPRGRYRDADHYLDVLFRLLREDFVRPLREGCAEYCQAKLAAAGGRLPRIQNMKVYENVWFDKLLSADESVGLELVFDPDEKLRRVNWEYSRRLIKGALLVLTRDMNFTSVTLASVSKRDVNQLSTGRVVVELCDSPVSEDLFEGRFLMVECVAFFGAYLHPLRALQALDEASLPLREYLVDASNTRTVPAYLQPGRGFTLPSPDAAATTPASVLTDVTRMDEWPSAQTLGLDDSQYLALQGALTNKVMLVQGPPGTGKTFLGLLVAKTLLLNQYLWRPTVQQPRPLLVLCSTNHALNQFLMGLLPFTQSIVRVGNPSREPALEPFDIFQLRRKKIQGAYALFQMIAQHKKRFVELKQVHDCVRTCYALLRQDGGLVHPDTLHAFGIITEAERDYFRTRPIQVWLLGPEAFAFGDFPDVVWSPGAVDLSCLEGEDIAALRRTVSYVVSIQKLEAAIVGFIQEEEMAAVVALRRYQEAILAGLTATETQPPEMLVHAQDLSEMTEVERWQQYRFWKKELVTEFETIAEEVSSKYLDAAQQVQECRMVQEQTIMANHLVIGMCMSYAAMRHRILKELKPRVVIVEEAAEVLEATLLASLGVDVEHLVMIGDHQQLRPTTSVPDLANNYHLNVSMFERLVNNGVNCVTLNTQHRMRPQVSSLICPHIYPNLLNHESVHHFPDIRGVTKNVFFLDHQYPEEEPMFLKDANSFQNSHEAYFISAFVRYLLLQGYDPSNITVLCTYKGQLYFLTKQIRPAEPHLRSVRITTVDEYQGEENDIVLLSLVRSNQRSNLGYVGIENRACVALSRARHGFFMIGNMSTLTSKDTVWGAVDAELRRQGGVGPGLVLRCEVHHQLTTVATAEDFEQCPQGGCLRRCGVDLRCGHVCPQVCHPDDLEHVKYKCQEDCSKVACLLGHPCRARCYDDCPPCEVPKRALLACGHEATMPCHRDPEDHRCQIEVDFVLPACGHTQRAKCSQRGSVEALTCRVPCEFRIDCGHSCALKCHVLDDPHHEKYKCGKPCEDLRDGCRANHKCRRVCHEDCEPCDVEVAKDLPCGHSRRMACKDEPLAELCTQKCRRTMPCDPSHRCGNMCRDPCGPCNVKVDKKLLCNHTQPVPCSVDAVLFQECSQLVEFSGVPACGHTIMVPCSSSYGPSDPELLSLCKEPCLKKLQCEHQCAGTCGQCRQGCFHVACNAKCKRLLMCGHVCEAPCATSCPPCRKACPVKCRHTKCGRTCGERCAPCKEPCPLECPHMKCPSLCGEPCPQDPCSEPCTRVVKKCGHACVGLCGETCVCRECSDIEVFFGTEDEDDARFVVLPDCKHLFEVTSLDHWILSTADEEGNNKAITKKECPRCKTSVDTSLRYGNVTKQNAADVAEIKERLFGTWTTIDPVAKQTREILKALPVPERLTGFPAMSDLVQTVDLHLGKVEKRARGRKRGARAAPHLSLTGMQSLHQYVSVLSSLHKAFQNVSRDLRESKRAELEGFVELLCREIKRRDLIRLSDQEAGDINAELARFHLLAEVCRVESQFSLQPSALAYVTRAVRNVGPYDMSKDGEVRAQLEKLAKITLNEEILSVKAALGLAKGHWFKCPNGHFYVITECGGAMQESICNECRAPIGGTNHRLRSDNDVARELGETAPAWPM